MKTILKVMKIILRGVALAAVIALACVSAQAQVTTAPTIKLKQPKAKIDKYKGEVVNCNQLTITVRDPKNITIMRTFTYGPALKGFMETRFIETASKITVRYMRFTDTAVGLQAKIIPR